MADAPTPTPGSMGFRGILWQNLGNTSAMVVICFLFVGQSWDGRQQAREDRHLFRETQQANDRRFEQLATRLDANTTAMRQAIDRLDAAHRVIRDDVRRLKADAAGPIPAPREKPQ